MPAFSLAFCAFLCAWSLHVRANYVQYDDLNKTTCSKAAFVMSSGDGVGARLERIDGRVALHSFCYLFQVWTERCMYSTESRYR